MRRKITRPTTAKCELPKYTGFLLCEPKSATCTRLSELSDMSHDSVNRFLQRENFGPKDLFMETAARLVLDGGTLSVDDTVLDKSYSHYTALVGHYYSGKHHKAVKGINLITLYYTDIKGYSLPVNFRIYDPTDGKTKNDYFIDMLKEVLAWGLKPACVTGDSWYSSIANLKAVKKNGLGFMFAVKSNRTVSVQKGDYQQVQSLEIPEEGRKVWLRNFGYVRLYRTRLKNELRHYVVYTPHAGADPSLGSDFKQLHQHHWAIEEYHRALKQLCNIERFQVRGEQQVRNHIFASIFGYTCLQAMKVTESLRSIYSVRKGALKEATWEFIKSFSVGKEWLKPSFIGAVNA